VQFTISARGKQGRTPILRFIGREFEGVPMAEIDSVFGFVEHTPLYGGRPFSAPELSPRDVETLRVCGVGLRLPLSNHHASREEYESSRALLERHHRRGNSVIVQKDEMARWIRRDYPEYEIEASVIKEVDTHDGVRRALETYDTVVLPMRLTQDLAFLERIEEKSRIRLFANAGCALNCPARICYPSFSRFNRSGGKIACSYGTKPRDLLGMIDFDLAPLTALGFVRFKLLRTRQHGLTGF
jgi:hypothetical protein